MGRRKAPGSGSLGRALIRQQTQRSRGHRHTDAWVSEGSSPSSASVCGYAGVNAASPGARDHETFLGVTSK